MEEEYQEELRQYYLQYPPDEYQNESTLAETEQPHMTTDATYTQPDQTTQISQIHHQST